MKHIIVQFNEQYKTAANIDISPISGVVPIFIANQKITVRLYETPQIKPVFINSFRDSIRLRTKINGTRLNQDNQPKWRGC